MMQTISRNSKYRITIGSLLVAIFVTLVVLSHTFVAGILFNLFIAAVVALGLWEYYQLAIAKGHDPLVKLGMAAGAIYIIAHLFGGPFPLMILTAALFAGFVYYFKQEGKPLENLAITFFGLLYIALPMSCILLINHFSSTQDDRWWLFYIITLAKVTDVAGFCVGKAYGKTPLAPHISPKKTVEGALGALFLTICVSILFPVIASIIHGENPINLSYLQTALLGCIISILAQFGDLAESLLKRDAHVKDSNQLPGLGGTLDIIDSLIFALPFGYFVLIFLNRYGA